MRGSSFRFSFAMLSRSAPSACASPTYVFASVDLRLRLVRALLRFGRSAPSACTSPCILTASSGHSCVPNMGVPAKYDFVGREGVAGTSAEAELWHRTECTPTRRSLPFLFRDSRFFVRADSASSETAASRVAPNPTVPSAGALLFLRKAVFAPRSPVRLGCPLLFPFSSIALRALFPLPICQFPPFLLPLCTLFIPYRLAFSNGSRAAVERQSSGSGTAVKRQSGENATAVMRRSNVSH